MRDRNGNKTEYTFDANERLTSITDTLGRIISIAYNPDPVNDPQAIARITAPATNGGTKTVTVRQRALRNLLRNPLDSVQATDVLFPKSVGYGTYDPKTISEIELPTGFKWKFLYNTWGEVSRVETPAGGAVEYETEPMEDGSIVGRRTTRRSTFASLDTSEPGAVTTYGDPTQPMPIKVKRFDGTTYTASNPGTPVSYSDHYFHGSIMREDPASAPLYRYWYDGLQYKVVTWAQNESGVTLEQSRQDWTWQQKAAVFWYDNTGDPDPTMSEEPKNDPRLASTKTTLVQGNLATKTDYLYDGYNNVLEETIYDYGTAPNVGPMLKKVKRVYAGVINGVDYRTDTGGHMRSLVDKEEVFGPQSSTTPESRVVFEYDGYSGANRASLVPRTITNGTHSSADFDYSSTNTRRGNVTAVTSGVSETLQSFSQYDVCGNVVKSISATGLTVSINYDDPFEISPRSYVFAYPTSAQWSVGAQPFSWEALYSVDTGALTRVRGVNGDQEETTWEYDANDRMTRVIGPVGTGQTRYYYSQPGAAEMWMSQEVQIDSGASEYATSFVYFDGLFRTKRTEASDPNGSGMVTVKTLYDGLGRPWLVSNPYRASVGSELTDGWTRRLYDGLDRVWKVSSIAGRSVPTASTASTTGDVMTSYVGAETTATDQADARRTSRVDALGRVIWVKEDPTRVAGDGRLNYQTTYTHDARGNLRRVLQEHRDASGVLLSSQNRYFGFDSLGRLVRVKLPEQAGNASLAAWTDPVTGIASWAEGNFFNAAGQLARHTDARNESVTFSYDAAGRALTENTHTGATADASVEVRHFYDSAANAPAGVTMPGALATGWSVGRLVGSITYTSAGAQETGSFYGYDLGGRANDHVQRFGTSEDYRDTATFNYAGAPKVETYPSLKQVTNTYKPTGRLDKVERTGAAAPLSSGIGYTAGGGLASQTLGNGLVHTLAYNTRNQPATIGLGTSLTTETTKYDRLKLEYFYGGLSSADGYTAPTAAEQQKNNGNVAQLRITNPGEQPIVQNFLYDAANRLTMAKELYEQAGTSAPSITSVTPSSGTPGTSVSVTIAGSNLSNASAVTVSGAGVTASGITSSATSVSCTLTIAAGATTGARTLTVTTPGGTSNGLTFTVSSASCTATTTSISPNSGAQGQAITGVVISGTNLSGATAVSFSGTGVTATVTATTASSVTCTVTIASTAATGARTVTVATPSCGSPQLASAFTVNAATASDSALSLDGINDFARAADSTSLSVTGSITVEAWIRPTQTGVKQVIVSKRKIGTGGTDFGGYELRLNAANQVVFATLSNAGASLANVQSTGVVAANTWQHVSGSYDGTTMRVSIGGSITSASVGTGKGPVDGGTPLKIGLVTDSAGLDQDFFKGKIDKVRVSNTARYTATFTPSQAYGSDPNARGMWELNEGGTATTSADATANGNTLTLQNGIAWGTGVSTNSKRGRRRAVGSEAVTSQGPGTESILPAGEEPESKTAGTSAVTATSWYETYGYDPYGNRTSIGGTKTTVTPAISASTNRFSGLEYQYDAAGNLTRDVRNTQYQYYVYDAKGRLTQVKDANQVVVAAFTYDGAGRRVMKVAGAQTTRYIYSGRGALLAEYTGSTPARAKELVYGPAGLLAHVEVNGTGVETLTYPTPDRLGTPRVVTNASKGVVSRHDYMPFGGELFGDDQARKTAQGYLPADTSTLRQKYTGYERDKESDLDFAQARYFQSTHGRFTAVDPLQASGATPIPQSWNRYVYTYNNPLRYTDPGGMMPYGSGIFNYCDYYGDEERAERDRHEAEANREAGEASEFQHQNARFLTTLGPENYVFNFQVSVTAPTDTIEPVHTGVGQTITPTMSGVPMPESDYTTLNFGIGLFGPVGLSVGGSYDWRNGDLYVQPLGFGVGGSFPFPAVSFGLADGCIRPV